MKKILLTGLIAIFIFSHCSKNVTGDIPACIKKQIKQLKNQAKRNPPAQINEYWYNGRKAYLISADCCDQYNRLVSEDCKYICAPSGGLTGRGEGKCNDFFQQAKHSRLIWKDER